MFLGDVLDALKSQGFDISGPKVHRAIDLAVRQGRVQRPQQTSAGNCIYTDAHLDAIRTYLTHPPRRGRRPRAERLAAQAGRAH